MHEQRAQKWQERQDRRGKKTYEVKKDDKVIIKCGHLNFPEAKNIGKPFLMTVITGKLKDLTSELEVAAEKESITIENLKKALPNIPSFF